MKGMKNGSLWPTLALAGLLQATTFGPLMASDSPVSVSFSEPDRYIDAGTQRRERERNLELIEQFFVEAAEACLAEGQRLALRIFDVDLAGHYEWWQPGGGVRIMREIDWPRIKIEFEHFDPEGQRLALEREWIQDMNYLKRPRPPTRDGRLAYERRMIRDWVDSRFCAE